MADALQGLWPRDSVCLDVDLAELALQNGLHADSELRTFFTVTAPREAFSIQMVNGSTDASQGFISMFRHREKLYKQNKYLLA